MAENGKKISEQNVVETLQGDELIPFAKNGTNAVVKADTIKEFAQDGLDDTYATIERVNDQLDGFAPKSWLASTDQEVSRINDALISGLNDKADKDAVPTKVSELENDAQYQDAGHVSAQIKVAINAHEADVEERFVTIEDRVADLDASKVSKEVGKKLSSNDFTDEDKAKLAGIESGAQVNTVTSVNGRTGAVTGLAEASAVPTKVSQLTNDSKFQTESQVNATVQKVVGAAPEALDTLEEIADKLKDNDDAVAGIVTTLATKANKSEIPTKVSQLTNDSGYLTTHQDISGKADKSEIPTKVSQLTNDSKYQTESQVKAVADTKVDKVTGKVLSSNDYTDSEKSKLGALPTNAELTTTLGTKADKTTMNTELAKKVDKVTGKQLSTEDFTTLLKQKLEGLTNYDDTTLTDELNALKSRLDTLVGSGDVTAVIDTFQEIENFLQGITNTQTLTGLLQEMKSEIVALCADTYVSKTKDEEISGAKTFTRPIIIKGGFDKKVVLSNTDGEKYSAISFQENGVEYAKMYATNDVFDFSKPIRGTFKKANGTSSQFLKADGSVDGTAYLPTSGGTMTGELTIKTDTQPCLKLDSNTANKEVFMYVYSNGAAKACFGWSPTAKIGAYLYNSACQKRIGITDAGTPHFNGSTLWHEGNDGSGSGLDADLLDGKQPADLNVGSADKLTTKQLTNEDLNEIKTDGTIYWATSGNSCTNRPSIATGTGFSLQVLRNSSTYYVQIYTDYNGNILKRYYNGSTWSSWQQLATTDGAVAKLTTKQLTNEDLNTILYSSSTNDRYFGNIDNTCTNKPVGITSFNLSVYKVSSITFQLIIVNNGDIYTRRFNASTSTWSAWKKMLTEDDVTKIQSVASVPSTPSANTLYVIPE